MTAVWDDDSAKEFMRLLLLEVEGFVTICIISPSGGELAKATTQEGTGYEPCWQTATALALGATGGADIHGLSRDFQKDYPRDGIESPRSHGVGLRLFKGTEVVGAIGVLGLPLAEVIPLVSRIAQQNGLSIAHPPR